MAPLFIGRLCLAAVPAPSDIICTAVRKSRRAVETISPFVASHL